jgi:hypothetical protein
MLAGRRSMLLAAHASTACMTCCMATLGLPDCCQLPVHVHMPRTWSVCSVTVWMQALAPRSHSLTCSQVKLLNPNMTRA